LPAIFDMLTLQDATKLVATADKLGPGDREALDFYRGDHWRGGLAWPGQKPPPGEQYQAQMAAIAAGFVSKNVTREVVQRHRAGVLGKEPRWSFVPRRDLGKDDQGQPNPPTAEEQARIGEAEAALTAWWDRRKLLASLQQALDTALLIRRAPLRLLIPGGLRDANGQLALPTGTVEADRLAAALDALYLDGPSLDEDKPGLAPDACGTFTDDATRREVGIFAYKQAPADKPFAALLTDTTGGTEAAELTYLNDDGTTTLRVLTASGEPQEAAPLPLGGRILIHELRREALITAQVRQGQKSLNLALTQMVRNVNLAGSLERIFVNVKPPGRTVDEAGDPWVEGRSTGEPTFIPESLPTGAAVSAFLRGVEVRDANGELTGYANGTVNYRDPVPVGTFTETDGAFTAGILEETSQLHVLIGKDAQASGEARKQARAEFANSLKASKATVDDSGRWVLETALALAAVIAGTPGRFDDLRCDFGAVIDAGPLTADERAEIVAEFAAGLSSKETTLSSLGVDDTGAEMARIAAEDEAKQARAAELAKQQAALMPAPVAVPGPGQQREAA
jgi:hypothetical protein